MPLKLVAPRRGRSPNWRIRGTVRGISVDETTGTSDRDLAEAIRIKREAAILERSIFGERVGRTFAETAIAYVETVQPAGTQRDAVIGRQRKDGSITPNLVDHFGPWRLAQIDQSAVDDIIRRRYPTASSSTIQRQILTPLIAVMRFGARRGWCDPPMLDRPEQPPGRKRWATYDEADRLLLEASPHIRVLIRFLMFTGARMAEALHLEWAEVDLGQRWAVLRDTKNGEDRGIPLHRQVVAELANLPYRDGRVFRTNRGRPYAEKRNQGGGQIKTAWAATCRRAEVTGITPHDLRHTCSTWLTMAGVHEQVRDEIMGHASTGMGRRYSHVPRPMLLEAVDKLPDRVFSVERPVRRIAKRKLRQRAASC